MNNLIQTSLGQLYLPSYIYITDTIKLAKSITTKFDIEAKLWNQQLTTIGDTVSEDRKEWRYYKHLKGEYYKKGIIDQPIIIRSVDTLEDIELNKNTIKDHLATRRELLKFNTYYDEIVSKYPEQELLIRSIINQVSDEVSLESIIEAPEGTIVSYNSSLVESTEDSLMLHLQQRIYNYIVTRFIPYYHNSDELFLSVLMLELYQYIVLSLIALRQKRVKTKEVHSFHIKNYLASHHRLDRVFGSLSREQILYIYRNIKYLNNHSGKQFTFREIVDKIFTPEKISVVKYKYKQKNKLDDQKRNEVKFNQELVNSEKLPYIRDDFTLDDIINRERPLAVDNDKEHTYKKDKLDDDVRYTRHHVLNTKDIEILYIDYTDSVRRKLINVLINYLVYYIKTDRIGFLFSLEYDNSIIYLEPKDFLKLFTYLLFKANGQELAQFFDFTYCDVAKEKPLPSVGFLVKNFFNTKSYHKFAVEEIRNKLPNYQNIYNTEKLYLKIREYYIYYLALWAYESNISDQHDLAQIQSVVKFLHQCGDLTLTGETVDDFINRLEIVDYKNLSQDAAGELAYKLLDSAVDFQLSNIFNSSNKTKILVDIFNLLKSYTTQIINNSFSLSLTNCGAKDTRFSTTYDSNSSLFVYNSITNYDLNESIRATKDLTAISGFNNITIHDSTFAKQSIEMPNEFKKIGQISFAKMEIPVVSNMFEIEGDQVLPSEEDLLFLSLNPI